MQEFINVHCHLLNFNFVPDSYFRTRAPVRKWLLRNSATRWIARIVTVLLPGNKYDRLHEVLDIMNYKDIFAVADKLIQEMSASINGEIVLSIPLMMDLETTSLDEKPEIPYRHQVEFISDVAKKYPGQLMPFLMVDPRRYDVIGLVKNALEKRGFLGVKMYPSFGYDPNPGSFYNDRIVNTELMLLYRYCEDASIPITTHCSPSGSYNSDAISCRKIYQKYCSPSNWKKVLEIYPKLYLNFGHFGGCGAFLDKSKSEEDRESQEWNVAIQQLMREYEHVYADLAYHSAAVKPEFAHGYFAKLSKLMEDELIKHRIIFGTDWLMTRHTWEEKDFVNAFIALPPAILNLIALENPLDFLFRERKLPHRIKSFWDKNNISQPQYPQWVKKHLTLTTQS